MAGGMRQPGPASVVDEASLAESDVEPSWLASAGAASVDDSGDVDESGAVDESGGAELPASTAPLTVHSGVVGATPWTGQHTAGALVALVFGGVMHRSPSLQSSLLLRGLHG
jgi:hypothetical protein